MATRWPAARYAARHCASFAAGRVSGRLTEPIDMKKPNVAAEESMYWASVPMTPRGPGPPLCV